MKVKIIDNFVECPQKIRDSALESGFGTWRPNKGEVGSSIYEGMNFWGNHSPMIRGISKAMNCPIYPNDMFFRSTNLSTEGAYVHSDREAGDFTAIAYLSEHEFSGSGTGFFKHRESGSTSMKSFTEMAADKSQFERLKEQMVSGSTDFWEMIHFVPGRFNRAIIFEAPLFHARVPRHGYGDTPEDGRMVWACHFYT